MARVTLTVQLSQCSKKKKKTKKKKTKQNKQTKKKTPNKQAKTKRLKSKNTKWFDKFCSELKQEVLRFGKLVSKFPTDTYIGYE